MCVCVCARARVCVCVCVCVPMCALACVIERVDRRGGGGEGWKGSQYCFCGEIVVA